MTRKRWLSRLLMLARAVLGVALLALVLRSGGAWASLSQLFGVAWLVVMLMGFPLVGAAVEASRLGVLFGAQGLHLPFWTGFRVVSIGALFNLWVPGGTGGDVMKLYYIADRHAGRGIEVATILLVDRVVALFAMLTLILALLLVQLPAGLPAIARGATVGIVTALALLAAGTLVLWSSRIRTSTPYQAGLARLPFGRHIARAADAVYRFRARKSALLKAGLMSMCGHTLLALTMALAGRVLVPGVPPLLVSTLALLGLVANVLPVTPGGLGVGEAASEALFRSVGVTGGAGLIAAWRAGTILVCMLGTVFYIRGVRAPASPDVDSSSRREWIS